MFTLPFVSATGNLPASPSLLRAVAWHALSRVSTGEADRNALRAGGAHVVNLQLTGTVDGEPISEAVEAILTVGHDSRRASSALPQVGHLIGVILAKLNSQTREAILANLPDEFEAAGCELPAVNTAIVDQTTAMLSRLRAKSLVDVRGSVGCKYAMRSATTARSSRPRKPALAATA